MSGVGLLNSWSGMLSNNGLLDCVLRRECFVKDTANWNPECCVCEPTGKMIWTLSNSSVGKDILIVSGL